MDIYRILQELLQIDQENCQSKLDVINKGLRLDAGLISSLLGNEKVKKRFFDVVAVGEREVVSFKKEEFVQFLQNKTYLADSYTQFRNSIGLGIGRQLLSKGSNVQLIWPYKDCLLEGGQTTEEHNRQEIFFNQELAQSEISKLLEPKVLTNIKVFRKQNSEGEYIQIPHSGHDNLFIKGNNLIALSSIREKYRGKIKLVYMDPPYNTPGEANTFLYNNSFNHSTWLTFMKDRLKIARELMSDNGFICLAIDDVEYAYLKVLADEILGRENFLASVSIQIKKEGRTDSQFFATSHDYAIFYCKDKSKTVLHTLPKTKEELKAYKEVDAIGKYKWKSFMRTGGNATPKERWNQEFPFYISSENGVEKIVGVGGISSEPKGDYIEEQRQYNCDEIYTCDENGSVVTKNLEDFQNTYESTSLQCIWPVGQKQKRQVWRWSDREKIMLSVKEGEIQHTNKKIQIKDRIKMTKKPTTVWSDKKYNATSHGTNLVKKMFGQKVFSYPKSLHTMIDILRITTTTSDHDIILDVFGGSGTTGHAVCELNKEDNGNRHFIIMEQLEYAKTVTAERISKVLHTQNPSFTYFELKQYNERFIVDIHEASSVEELLTVWKLMRKKSFINYNVDIKKLDKKIHQEENNDFLTLTLEEQKELLFEILDKNFLYVPLSSLDDTDFECTEEEKQFTKSFYQLEDGE